MADGLVSALRAAGLGRVLADERLAGHTTLKVGGPARAMVRVDTADELVAAARVCADHRVPWLILGRGSNLLVADDGWPGVVVTLGRGFRGVHRADHDEPIVGRPADVLTGAAEPMPVLANTVAGWGLGGIEFGVAIPGSVGGAVRMNAGAHDGQMRDVLVEVEVVRLGDATVATLPADRLGMEYRHTRLPDDAVVVRARLRLRHADQEELAARMAEMRRWRRTHQPINVPSCGSVFRNPPGDSAGRLIEASGMKGHRVGGAQVSPVHANFITVSPGARAADVYAVIGDVSAAVRRDHGVALETEVVIAGFDQSVSGAT